MYVSIDKRCSGCGACGYACPVGCIQFMPDDEGFSFPSVDEGKCVDCGRCVKACPLNTKDLSRPFEALSYASGDPALVARCASGGAFSSIARSFLEGGGAVVGCADDVHLGSSFTIARTPAELDALAGSKYYQCNLTAEVLSGIQGLLAAGERVLFCGTPCQVQSVRNTMPVRHRNGLYLVDIVCQGVPSRTSIAQYRSEVEGTRGLEGHLFRSKLEGHEGEYITRLDYADGSSETRVGMQDPCARAFMYQVSLRESCYLCSFAQAERPGDVTLGDYWSSDLGPGFRRGSTSLVLVNTERGVELASHLSETGHAVKVTPEVGMRGNVPLHYPVKRPLARSIFYPLSRSVGFSKAAKVCCWRYTVKLIARRIKRRLSR